MRSCNVIAPLPPCITADMMFCNLPHLRFNSLPHDLIFLHSADMNHPSTGHLVTPSFVSPSITHTLYFSLVSMITLHPPSLISSRTSHIPDKRPPRRQGTGKDLISGIHFFFVFCAAQSFFPPDYGNGYQEATISLFF